MNPHNPQQNDYNLYNPQYTGAINGGDLQRLQQVPNAFQFNPHPHEPISANAFENALLSQISEKRTVQDQPPNGLVSPKALSPATTLLRQESPKVLQAEPPRILPQEVKIVPKETSARSNTFRQEITENDFTFHSKYGQNLPSDTPRSQVNSNTITYYQTDPTFNAGKVITTSNNYLLWGIRGGLLRVFHKFNCKNAVMKGHKQQVTDVKFYHNQSNFAVSASRDRTLILWEVSEKKTTPPVEPSTEQNPAPTKDSGLAYKIQLYVQQSTDQTHRFFKRIEWQPRRDARILYALSSLNEILAINLDTLMANATLVNDIRFVQLTNETEGVTVLHKGEDETINDIRFSTDVNSELFTAVTQNGKILIFNTSTMTKVYEQTLNANVPLWSVHFCGSKVRPKLYNSIVTGSNNNNDYTLWKFPDRNFTGEGLIEKVQSISIVSSNTDQETPQTYTNTVELDSSSACLLVANIETPTLFTLYLDEERFTRIAEYETNYPVVSFKSMTKFNEQDKNYTVGVFCLETEAVQLVSVTTNDILSDTPTVVKPQKSPRREPAKPKPQQAKPQVAPQTAPQQPPQQIQPQPQQVPKQQPPQQLKQPSPQPQSAPTTSNEPPLSGSADLRILLKEFQKMEKRITDKMEETIEKQNQKLFDDLYQRLERERLLRVKEERQKQEELLDTIAKAISQDIPNDVVGIIEERVVPAIGDELEERLTTVLQESLEKSLGSVVEQSITNSVRQPIQETFQQVLKATVIPQFQLSCQKMFSQISQAFDSGMEERIKKPLREHYTQVNQDTIQRIEQSLAQFNPGAVQSGAPHTAYETQHAPQPSTPKDKITPLLRSSRFDEAFTIALSSNDLKVVVWTCEQSTPDKVLPNLSQPVLLSLIQQVAFDLTKQVDMKLDWLERAILYLDPNEEAISSHVQPILQSVLGGLQRAFGNSEVVEKHAQKLKLLMHVVNSQIYGAK